LRNELRVDVEGGGMVMRGQGDIQGVLAAELLGVYTWCRNRGVLRGKNLPKKRVNVERSKGRRQESVRVSQSGLQGNRGGGIARKNVQVKLGPLFHSEKLGDAVGRPTEMVGGEESARKTPAP